VQLTEEEEDHNGILMIGGIGVFLPSAHEEAENSVADNAATAEKQSQLIMTVKEELEQVFETSQARAEAEEVVALELTTEEEVEAEEESEHSKEWLNAFSIEDEETATEEFAAEDEEEDENSEGWLISFSQGAEEKEAVALKLTAREAEEQADKVITPWEMELAMLEDWMNNLGPARELTEFELSEKRMTEQQVSQEEIAELKSAAEWQLEATDEDEDEEDGMGDHSDLPMCQMFLQLRRLQEQDQPREKLDEVIEEISRDCQ
jgi:hypothetical protein